MDGVVSSDVKGKISKIRDGCRFIFDNASSLYGEAQVLGGAGYFQRCTFLHLISIEECAKIDSLGAAAKGLLIGIDIDLGKLHKKLARHEVKNHINAWNFPFTAEEEAAHSAGNREEARVAANKLRSEYTASSIALRIIVYMSTLMDLITGGLSKVWMSPMLSGVEILMRNFFAGRNFF